MDEFAEMRKLKIEETALIKVLCVLKKQLNCLKVEELALAAKIREKSVVASIPSSCSAQLKPSTSNERTASQNLPENINKQHLNLVTGSGQALGGMLSCPLEDEEDEEMESEDDDVEEENNNPLMSFLDF